MRFYPRAWRARYGDELEALILDMSTRGRTSWRLRADVAWSGARERLHTAGLAGDGAPERRACGGVLLVLWAWALFVVAGAIVQKTSEHWQDGVAPPSRALASAAFESLLGVAIVASALVLAAIVWAMPSLVALVRGGGWLHLRRSVGLAATLTAVAAVATGGLIALAHGLSGHQRAAHATLYEIVFLGWAGLGASCLFAWTVAATKAAWFLELRPPILRGQARLAGVVTAAMGAMTVATATWWASVAHISPSALTGGSVGPHRSALVPELAVAMVLMVLATAFAIAGSRRALCALPALPSRWPREGGDSAQ